MHERTGWRMNGQFDLGEITPLRYFATIAIVVGLLFALISGGEEGAPPLPLRLLQWQLQSCLPMALMVLSQLSLARLPFFDGLNTWVQLAVSGALGAALFTPMALGIDALLYGDPVSLLELADEFSGVAPPVVLCWLAINAPWVLGFRLQSATPSDTSSASAPGLEPPFYAMVPDTHRGELYYLEAELHYVAVVTSRGRSLILYNLRDAIDELHNVAGVQPHRSYWVAAAQVEGLQRRGRQGVLHMRNGDEVPVSRRNLAAIQTWYQHQSANDPGQT
jgi:hypothetical protein